MKRTVSLLLALALLLGLAACGSAGETVIAPGAEAAALISERTALLLSELN